MGWTFLWPFLDKMFGLGHDTTSANAWISGGNPSKGFLSGAIGPFGGLYQSIAGEGWVNWLFMLGLLGIGAALLLGVAMRLACAAGALLLVLMWSASLPPDNDLFMDNHIIYALLLAGLVLSDSASAASQLEQCPSSTRPARCPWQRDWLSTGARNVTAIRLMGAPMFA